MGKKNKFLSAVYYHYDNLAKTAKLALFAVGVVAASAVAVIAVKVAVAL